jgi:hypothetical protein
MRVILFLGLIVGICSSPATSQTAGSLPRVLDLPASTRAMALGDAYMMDAGRSDAIFYHPALLTGASGFGIEFQRWGSPSSAAAVSAATQWFGVGVGVGMLTLQYGAPGIGPAVAPAGQDHLFDLGPTPVSERVAVVAVAREFGGISIGVAGQLIEERIEGSRDADAQFDLSGTREVGPVTLGVRLRDWGTDPETTIGVGTYGRELGIFDYGLTAAAAFDDDDARFSGGVELGYWPIQGRTFVGRIGVRDVPDGSQASPLTFGFAFWGDELVLEWAFHPIDGAADGGTHRFGVRWQ